MRARFTRLSLPARVVIVVGLCLLVGIGAAEVGLPPELAVVVAVLAYAIDRTEQARSMGRI